MAHDQVVPEYEIVNTISALTGALNPGVKPTLPSYRLDKSVTSKVKILTFDIETTPHLVRTWGLWDQNVSLSQIVETSRVFCFVAKWYDKSATIFKSDFHDGHEAMVRAMHALLDEADIVVGYNSKSFDVKHMNREFILLGLGEPSPFINVDLMLTAKRKFKFASNKLDHVASELGLGTKTAHTGQDLWNKCMAGDEKAWALMKKYNIQDVRLTEKLYDTLRPWIDGHPHLGMFTGEEWCCTHCGHKGISSNRNGTAFTNVNSYPRYQCPNCGKWIRGQKKISDATATRAARTS